MAFYGFCFADLCQDAASATRILGNTSGIAGLLSLVAARLHLLPFLSILSFEAPAPLNCRFCRAQVNQAGGKLSDYIGWTQQMLHLEPFANASTGKVNDNLLCSCPFAASLCFENAPIQFCLCYFKMFQLLVLSRFVLRVHGTHLMYTDSNSMQF